MTELFDSLKSAITRVHRELAEASFRVLGEGFDSVAIEADERLVFKFPKSKMAEGALLKEASLLATVRPRVAMSVPDMRIHHGPPIFSRHEKLPGEHLLTDGYDRLPEEARNRLAEQIGRFYAELHQLGLPDMEQAGATPILDWQKPETVRARALPALDPELRDLARDIVAAYEGLPPDPYGTVYGFFDGHGWNMAFDHERGVLNGLYDFADSGFGPLHQEFIYTNLISSDLTERVMTVYEALTGLRLDRRRVDTLTGFHRLSELAELADDPQHAPDMVRSFAAWAAVKGA